MLVGIALAASAAGAQDAQSSDQSAPQASGTGAQAPARDGNAPLLKVQGLWGWSFADDMTCEANPHRITYFPEDRSLVFHWPKSVTYSDGSVSADVDFEIVSVEGDRIELLRRRDGFKAVLIVSEDGKTYAFGELTADVGPYLDYPYTRCDAAGS